MCNLYNLTTSQEAIRALSKAFRDILGNMPPSVEVRPNYPAPIVRIADDGERELARLQWGMPSPPQFTTNYDRGVTNIRNVGSPHWRRWLGVGSRCVVPFTSFAEPSPVKDENGKTPNVWFAVNDNRPLAFFAGVWTRWHGVRKVKDGPGVRGMQSGAPSRFAPAGGMARYCRTVSATALNGTSSALPMISERTCSTSSTGGVLGAPDGRTPASVRRRATADVRGGSKPRWRTIAPTAFLVVTILKFQIVGGGCEKEARREGRAEVWV